MIHKHRFLILFLLIYVINVFALIPGEEKVISILEEVDTWITSDSTRIMDYIRRENKKTMDKLRNSKYWNSIEKDLTFLLSVDYVGSSEIDNTGRIYYLMRITGEASALFYTDKPMGFPIQLSPNNWIGEGKTVGDYLVHPSGDYLLALVHKHGNELFDIYRFNRDGSFKPILVNERIEFRISSFKNKDEFVFLINDHKDQYLAVYSQKGGSIDTLYTEEHAFWPLDYKDGKVLCIRWFSFSENQLFLVDERTHDMENISERGYYLGGEFTKSGKILTLTTEFCKDEDFPVFAIIDFNGEPGVIYKPGVEVDDYELAYKKDIVITSLNREGYSDMVAFNLKGKKVTVPEMDVGIITGLSSNDYGIATCDFTSPTTPPTSYSFRINEKEIEKIAKISTFGFDFSNIDVKLIHYPSTDGTMIPAFIYIPEDAKKDGNNPAMIIYHGGPPSQSRPYFQRNFAFALSKGLIIMLPNVRGSEGYGPDWERADNGEGRFQALEDAKSAIDYLIDEGWSKNERIAIKGASYGGQTVNYLSVRYPKEFACAVSEVGVADLDYTTTHGDITFQKGWEIEYGPIGSELTHNLSAIFYSTNLEKPILITTGSHDPRVVPSDPRRFSWVLNRLGKDILYYEETKAGHGSTTKSQLIENFTRSYTFIFENIMN